MSTCPECGEEYSTQGMYGHLRMGHGLRGDELEQTYQQTREESGTARRGENKPESDESGVAEIPEVPTPTEQDREPAKDREPVDHGDRVSKAADRLRRAKQRLEEVEAKTGQEVEREKEPSGLVDRLLSHGLVSKFLLGQTDTETTIERTEAEEALCRECREEVKAAERELEKALEHEQVDRRYARTDT